VRVLVSGAGIAGPVLAYWLTRHGVAVTVVERAPTLRAHGGSTVSLLPPALDVSARMGVLAPIEALATTRPADVGGANPVRRVDILRDDLSATYHAAGGDDVDYVFGDSITGIDADGEVTFEKMPARTFDVIVGADGLHSTVRRLTFGAEADVTRFLGGYVAVASVPKELANPGEVVGHVDVGRRAAISTADHLQDARAVFLFRAEEQLGGHHGDAARQREVLREVFTGMHPQVDSWLIRIENTPAWYFDTIGQLRLDRLSRRRVTLVGDAGYCAGPATGASTSLAVLGAYVLAGELARSKGDHLRAFAAYELAMREPVRLSRGFARNAARSLIPGSRAAVWASTRGAELVSRLPTPLARTTVTMRGVRVYDSMHVPDYPAIDD